MANGMRVGFQDLMYYAIDSNSPESGPILNNNLNIAIFYVFQIVLGGFLFMNLIIGVLYYEFSRALKFERLNTFGLLNED